MSKKLRIWVAMVQALLAVSVLSWAKFGSGTVYDYYAHGIRDLVTHLNLPLAIMWIVVSFPFHWLSNYIPPATGLAGSALTALLAAGMAFSVAAFWYLVVTEIQMRRRGLSMLRPLSRLWASFVVVALFCFGAGVFTYACPSVSIAAQVPRFARSIFVRPSPAGTAMLPDRSSTTAIASESLRCSF